MMSITAKNRLSRLLAVMLFLFLGSSIIGCAVVTKARYDFQTAYAKRSYEFARQALGNNPAVYGKQNTLLYYFDKGMFLQIIGDYPESSIAFEQAKKAYDRLFTKSITGATAALLTNNCLSSYRGRDYERVMVNNLEALNFLIQGNFSAALVEARNVDLILNRIGEKYPYEKHRTYRDDGFAHLLFGIAYEASGFQRDYDDAYIEFSRAEKIYSEGYYRTPVPDLLKESLLKLSKFLNRDEFKKYQEKYSDILFFDEQQIKTKAIVYLVYYNGQIPEMAQDIIPIPLPDGYIVSAAFPKYVSLDLFVDEIVFFTRDFKKKTIECRGQLAQDLDVIAREFLNNEQVWYTAKTIASMGMKYTAERQIGKIIKEKWNSGGQIPYQIIADAYNLFTGTADTRGWQTLPAKIYLSRLILDPGEYEFFVKEKNKDKTVQDVFLGKTTVIAGQVKFFIARSSR